MEHTKKTNQLVEIKAGKTGYGLLVEHDGYVSADLTENNKKIIKEIFESKDNDEWYVPKPFVMDVVLQKFGIENANKRIYPESVLKREVAKYQRLIDERMALGECYKPDVLVLTEDGWRALADIKEGDNILTLNTTTDEIEIQPVQRKIERDFSGNLIKIAGRSILDEVTPNHGYPLYDRNHKFKFFKTAQELMDEDNLSHYYIPKLGNWTKRGNEFFILPGIESPTSLMLKYHPDCMSDKKIPMSTFMKFMGIYLSEGSCMKRNSFVRIFQKKEVVSDMIDALCHELDLSYSIRQRADGCKVFEISDPRLQRYLQPLGNCYSKYIPKELKQQSKENLRLLYDWFVLGDGRVRGDKRRTKNKSLSDDVFSSSKQLILDLNEIQLKIGYSGNYHIEDRGQDRLIGDRLIEGKNCRPLHFSLRSLTRGIYIDKRFINISETPYEGKVMCLEVENHTWYVMSNGKCHWTKNCNHPEHSEIDLGRVAFNVIECHWEGHTLVGKIEFNITEGFRRYGICSSLGDTAANLILNGYKVGVSSRGIGSVKSQLGKTIVDDDFELICWDVVASPSTNGAYIGTRENLQQYVESEEKGKNKSKLNEKIEKLSKLLS